MSFAVRTRTQPGVTGLDATIYTLDDGAGGRIEVWPALGFNCFSWQAVVAGRTLDLLYADPNLFSECKGTRSGIPILFPFPNRIRGGHFQWDGKEYQLPHTDTVHHNAIHGFACRRPWRVVDQGADANAAWLTGEFRGSTDARDCAGLWPADYEIRATYRLTPNRLRLDCEVVNPDRVTLPFGLGYHPYYRFPFVTEVAAFQLHGEGPGRFVLGVDELRADRPAPRRRPDAGPQCSATVHGPHSRRRAHRFAAGHRRAGRVGRAGAVGRRRGPSCACSARPTSARWSCSRRATARRSAWSRTPARPTRSICNSRESTPAGVPCRRAAAGRAFSRCAFEIAPACRGNTNPRQAGGYLGVECPVGNVTKCRSVSVPCPTRCAQGPAAARDRARLTGGSR